MSTNNSNRGKKNQAINDITKKKWSKKEDLMNWFIRYSQPIHTGVFIIFVCLIFIQTGRMVSQGKIIQEQGVAIKKMCEVMEQSSKVLYEMFSDTRRGSRPLDISIVNDEIKILNIGDSIISIKEVYMETKDSLLIPIKYENNPIVSGKSLKIYPNFDKIADSHFPSDKPFKEVIMSIKFAYKGQPPIEQKWKYFLVKPNEKIIPLGITPITVEKPDIRG